MESRYHSQHRQETILHRRRGPSEGDRFERWGGMVCAALPPTRLPEASPIRTGLCGAGARWHEVQRVVCNNLDHYSWRLLEGKITSLCSQRRQEKLTLEKSHKDAARNAQRAADRRRQPPAHKQTRTHLELHTCSVSALSGRRLGG